MIPKKIHYCWLSDDPLPELISKCFNTWKKILPDYEFILWDTNKFPLESNLWVKQAFENKKYAFAADYIRLHAVYNYGGIYLDGDIEVLKKFDDLLHLPYFFGSEGSKIVEAGVFGAEKGSQWIGDCLKHYDNRSFIKDDGSLDILTLPLIMMNEINKNYNIVELESPNITALNYSADNETLYMFPKDYFCAKNHGNGLIEKTNNTYCIHHFAMSWLPKKRTFLPNLKRKLMSIFGINAINGLIRIFGLKKIKKILSKSS